METLSNVAVSAVTPCIFMQKNFFFVVVSLEICSLHCDIVSTSFPCLSLTSMEILHTGSHCYTEFPKWN